MVEGFATTRFITEQTKKLDLVSPGKIKEIVPNKIFNKEKRRGLH